MAKKVKGLKNKGYKNPKYEKMPDKIGNDSEEYAECHSDGKGKKVQSGHVGPQEQHIEKPSRKKAIVKSDKI